MSDFNIEEELKKLPHHPGVYIMHDDSDAIIYVGKAIDLNKRVHSYFRTSTKKTAKISRMVSLIDRFEFILTDSELEALVLENNLIKEHRPKYNTLLKDDKTYPYIKVTVQEEFPRLLFSRVMKKDKSRYFGPYSSAGSVRDTIELLSKLFKIRTCNKTLPRDIGKDRACLNYHMGQCDGPCIGKISAEEYKTHIDEALSFLNGHYAPVIKELEEKMNKASEELDFEKAAEIRDLLSSVQAVAQKQKITDTGGDDKDVIALAQDDTDAVVQVFFVRSGQMIGREHYYMKDAGTESDDPADVLLSFIKQYYSGTPFLPSGILLSHEIEDRELIEDWLSSRKEGRRVSITVPKIGQKEKFVELAIKNAETVLISDKERIRKEHEKTLGAVAQIEQITGLEGIRRMEAFDISNTNGFESVGSMVVFVDGKPKRSDYRKFKIKTVEGPNDYASMKEVLLRRFKHGLEEMEENKKTGRDDELGRFSAFPDLLLMDGGRGQVNICLEVLNELKLSIPVCGMVKDDHHRTRGLYFNNEELPIDTHSEGFKLITRVQDEAHRFAIEYHRSLRGKKSVSSILDEIPGVGPSRRKALMRSFDSLDDIRAADVVTLSGIPEITEDVAQSIYEFFHKG